MEDKPPLVYKEILGVAEALVMNYNGGQAGLWRKADTFSANRTVKTKEAELKRKNREISTLKADISNLKKHGNGGLGGGRDSGGGGYSGGRVHGGGQERRQPGEVRPTEVDKVFVKDRLLVSGLNNPCLHC